MEDGSLNHLGVLDTERDIWRVLERLACVGVWSEHSLCLRTKKYLQQTFGVWEAKNETVGESCWANGIDFNMG